MLFLLLFLQDPAAISPAGRAFYSPKPAAATLEKLSQHRLNYKREPTTDHAIWFGRFTAYCGAYQEAIQIYSKALEKHEDARLYRHRGHRYISVRQIDKAIQDLEHATLLIAGKENEIEPDGMPNPRNIPVSTLHGNIFYHLGLAYYLKGDLKNALKHYEQCLATSNNPDNLVSATHWLVMIHLEQGNLKAIQDVLTPIQEEMDIIENMSYHQLCLYYKGKIPEQDLMLDGDQPANAAVQFGVANWKRLQGEEKKAAQLAQKLLSSPSWTSFGFIAAESRWPEIDRNLK